MTPSEIFSFLSGVSALHRCQGTVDHRGVRLVGCSGDKKDNKK
jgi:hypothetical protein